MAIAISHVRGIRSRRQFLRALCACGSIGAGIICAGDVFGADSAKPALAWNDAPALVGRLLALRSGYRPGDLIARGDATPIFDELAKLGWAVANRDKLLALMVEDNHFLARELRTPTGLKFMREVAKEANTFDRLDRLSAQPGGEHLIHDMMRLPNGQDLLKNKPTAGFSDLTILLPKNANGKTPKIKDFEKPTGKIYTEADLVKGLEASWKAKK